MRYLFFFAHPDDETVSTGATIKRLTKQGDEVFLVSATDGSAGEVHERARENLKKFGSVAALRRHELQEVATYLGIKKLQFFHFADGHINNLDVWGSLKEACIASIDECKPDVVVTFDHSGWYFHLDHIAISLATTLAFHESAHRPEALLHVCMQVKGTKWKYVFPEEYPITHRVNANAEKEAKLHAVDLHASQDVEAVRQKILSEKQHDETFQLVFATKKGEEIFDHHPIFQKVSE